MSFDTLNTAREILLTSTSQNISGSIQANDPFDYYRLRLEGRSSLQVSLTGLSSNVNLELVQDSNRNGAIESTEILFQSNNSAALSELLTTPLNAGVYFIRVAATTESSSYSLSFSALSDVKTDLIWRNTQTGENAVWFMNGTTLESGAMISRLNDPSWQIVGTGEFNNDGRTDLVWRNASTGENAIWFMNGSTLLSGATFTRLNDPNWQIVGTGEFNNDGRTDLVWRNAFTGENAIWFMDGTTLLSGATFTRLNDPNWQIVATGEFNNDGRTDLVWRNASTGENAIWFMNGSTLLSGATFTRLSDRNWRIVDSGDYNNDGRADLVWRNTFTGENAVWFMNGSTLLSGAMLTSLADSRWQMVSTSQRFNEPPVNDAIGNTRSTAFNIGTLKGLGLFSNGLSSLDSDDVYQFSLTESSDVTLGFGQLAVGASIQLLDANGNVLAAAAGIGESINMTLNSGQYFARVFQTSGTGTYQLNLFGAARPTYQYNFTYYYNGQDTTSDYYTGTVVAQARTYVTGQVFDSTALNNETGRNGRYVITGIRGNGAFADLGKVFVEAYHDIDNSGSSFTPLKFSQGQASGTNYLGSELDAIGNANHSDAFGRDQTEADGIFSYRFRYLFSGGFSGSEDYYDGSVIARVGTYTPTGFHDAVNRVNEAGFNGRYYILDAAAYMDANARSQIGLVSLSSYYDSETNQSYSVVGSGQNLLGSEVGWLKATRMDEERFGEDFTEAEFRRIHSVSVSTTQRQGMYAGISWNDNISEDVRIELLKGGSLHTTLATTTASDGYYEWIPMTNFAIANDYQIRIISVRDSSLFSLSNIFSVVAPGNVTVTNPNGGNVLRPGSTYSINWTSSVSENVRIELFKGGVLNSTIATSTENDGTLNWTLPTNLAAGNDYQIRIASTTNSLVSDLSDSFFSVQVDLKKYWFYYYYNASNTSQGDYYFGTVIAPDGTYKISLLDNSYVDSDFFDPGTRTTEAGQNGKYLVMYTDDYDDRWVSDAGRVFIDAYYDRDNGREIRFTPTLFSQGLHSGSNYLGSELDYIDSGRSESAKFGQDFFEADPNFATVSNLSFSAREGEAGTFQLRLAYAPTSDVTVTFTGGQFLSIDADNTLINGSQNSITFTAANWNTARTIWFFADQDNTSSNRTSGNTISYSLSGGFTGNSAIDLGTIVNTYSPDNNRFNIDLDFRNDYLGFWTTARRSIAQRAANDWAARIVSELAGYTHTNQLVSMYNPTPSNLTGDFQFRSNRFIDDLVIFVGAYAADDNAGGWGSVREGGWSNSEPLPRVGMFTVHNDAVYYSDASLYSLISHELGHTLGLLGLNQLGSSLIDYTNAIFRGENARRANGGTYVALQAQDGINQVTKQLDYSHPSDRVDSIMNYEYQSAPTNIDFAMLADIGYRISQINALVGVPAADLPLIESPVLATLPDLAHSPAWVCGCMKHLAGRTDTGLHTIGTTQLADLIETV